MHALTRLLLSRIESHPEEFVPPPPPLIGSGYTLRWAYILDHFMAVAPDADKELFSSRLNAVRMDALHNAALDELLNGEERRATANQAAAQITAAQIAAQQYTAQQNAKTMHATTNHPHAYTNTATLGGITNSVLGLLGKK